MLSTICFRRLVPVAAVVMWLGADASGADSVAEDVSGALPVLAATSETMSGSWWTRWEARAREAEAAQPHWLAPLVTGTPLLEQQFRYDQRWQIQPNGSHLDDYDGGKGLELIPTTSSEVAINAPPFEKRTQKKKTSEGWGDWPLLAVKQRLASEDEAHGNYILSAQISAKAPTGIDAFTDEAWVITPAIVGGAGRGPFDIQASVGSPLPMRRATTIGYSLVGNAALQYHVARYFWPEFEVNATRWLDGQRKGKTQTLLTPGLMIGPLPLGAAPAGLVLGVGYQFAVTPQQETKPVDTPTFNHAWIATGRLAF